MRSDTPLGIWTEIMGRQADDNDTNTHDVHKVFFDFTINLGFITIKHKKYCTVLNIAM